MSTLKVNAIRGTGASADAITVNSTDGTCTTKTTNKVVHNFIYNGEMQINQRGTTTTVNGYGGPDRWKSNVSVGAFTVSQDTQSPNGFASSLKLDCTTAATASSNNNVSIQQHLEGLDLQGIKAGTSDAETLTLSFWVRCTKTGVFNTILYQKDGNKMAVQNTTISSADTWEKKTFSVSGNTADAIANDNSKSLTIEFWLDSGPSYKGGTVSGSWHTWADNGAGEGITLNIADNTSNDFYITGVQLEIGDVASDFAYRSYADELAKCKRYFSREGYGTQYTYVMQGILSSNTNARCFYRFPVTMRSAPTITEVGTLKVDSQMAASENVTGVGTSQTTVDGGRIEFTHGSHTQGQGQAIQIVTNDTTSGLDFSSEL